MSNSTNEEGAPGATLQGRSAEAIDAAYETGQLGFMFYWLIAKALVLALLAISYEIRYRP